MEDNPTKYCKKTFFLSAINPSTESWLSTKGLSQRYVLITIFKSKNNKKTSMPEKGFRTLSFYLRQCQIFEKTCRCSSFTCLTMPKERLLHFPAVRHSAKQNLPPGNRPWNLIQAHFLL